jgi:hypothetical protein
LDEEEVKGPAPLVSADDLNLPAEEALTGEVAESCASALGL